MCALAWLPAWLAAGLLAAPLAAPDLLPPWQSFLDVELRVEIADAQRPLVVGRRVQEGEDLDGIARDVFAGAPDAVARLRGLNPGVAEAGLQAGDIVAVPHRPDDDLAPDRVHLFAIGTNLSRISHLPQPLLVDVPFPVHRRCYDYRVLAVPAAGLGELATHVAEPASLSLRDTEGWAAVSGKMPSRASRSVLSPARGVVREYRLTVDADGRPVLAAHGFATAFGGPGAWLPGLGSIGLLLLALLHVRRRRLAAAAPATAAS